MIYSYNYQKLRKISLEEAITQNLEVCLFVFLNKQWLYSIKCTWYIQRHDQGEGGTIDMSVSVLDTRVTRCDMWSPKHEKYIQEMRQDGEFKQSKTRMGCVCVCVCVCVWVYIYIYIYIWKQMEVVEWKIQKLKIGTSLVVQWLGICLPLQGKQVRFLVWEDSESLRATGPMYPNYWSLHA